MNRSTQWALTVLVLAGCSPALPPAADPGKAKASLESALDAWAKGDTVESLRQRTTPIHFNDEVWRSGGQLEKYVITSEAANGTGWRCEVSLTLKSPGKNPVTRNVAYQIDTDPATVIVQQP